MAEGYWAIQKYREGPIGETIKYWVPGKKPERLTRQVKRDMKKAMQNKSSAIRESCRIVNKYFREGDGYVGLDYSEQMLQKLVAQLPDGLTQEESQEALFMLAKKQFSLFIRRLLYAAGKAGLNIRYWGATSDRKWDKVKKEWKVVRIHHHLFVSEAAKDYVFACWGDRGGVDWVPLSNQPDYTPIVTYTLDQVRHVPDAKKYVASRNMDRDFAEPARIALGPAEIRPPRGAVLLDRGAFRPGQPQYIRYILPNQYDESDTVTENGVVRVLRVEGHSRIRTGERDECHGV